MENEKLKCKECGQEFTKIDCVTRHVKIVHKIEPQAYYDKWFKKENECLFTCPPYGLKEIWNSNEYNLTCDQWIDECLKRFECKKYLFVVEDSIKYKDNIVETIENSSHFNKNKEFVILINK